MSDETTRRSDAGARRRDAALDARHVGPVQAPACRCAAASTARRSALVLRDGRRARDLRAARRRVLPRRRRRPGAAADVSRGGPRPGRRAAHDVPRAVLGRAQHLQRAARAPAAADAAPALQGEPRGARPLARAHARRRRLRSTCRRSHEATLWDYLQRAAHAMVNTFEPTGSDLRRRPARGILAHAVPPRRTRALRPPHAPRTTRDEGVHVADRPRHPPLPSPTRSSSARAWPASSPPPSSSTRASAS